MFTNSVFVIISVLLCLVTSTIAKTANKKPNSFSLKLLHRSSIPSFANENFQAFLENNKQLYLKESKFFTAVPLFQTTGSYLFFVNLSIGDPPVPQYLAVDTGSSMVWVIANSTNKNFLYRPGYSGTYTKVVCGSLECSLDRKFFCSTKAGSDSCMYLLQFANEINLSFGNLGFDRFVFPFPNEDFCENCDDHLDNVLFGVAVVTKGPLFTRPEFNGIVGLSPQSTSLLRNIPRKFKYCVGDIYDMNSNVSFLELGDIDDWNYSNKSKYVQLFLDEFYRVDMDCINFRQMCLSIEPDIFKYDGKDPFTGVIFDTGAVYTFLADEAYNALVDSVDEFMRSSGFTEPQNKDIQMCYKGQRENISDFPPFSFQFVDTNPDLRLRLEKGSLFYNISPELFCITIIKSSYKNVLMKDFTIIGLMAQQNHTLLFDLEASRMSIEYTSCET